MVDYSSIKGATELAPSTNDLTSFACFNPDNVECGAPDFLIAFKDGKPVAICAPKDRPPLKIDVPLATFTADVGIMSLVSIESVAVVGFIHNPTCYTTIIGGKPVYVKGS